jgi:hypothetical protein
MHAMGNECLQSLAWGVLTAGTKGVNGGGQHNVPATPGEQLWPVKGPWNAAPISMQLPPATCVAMNSVLGWLRAFPCVDLKCGCLPAAAPHQQHEKTPASTAYGSMLLGRVVAPVRVCGWSGRCTLAMRWRCLHIQWS